MAATKIKKTFAEWMHEVDKAVSAKAGLSVYDLPDMCFSDWYADGATPKQAAGKALKNAREE
jgi:hypothetical protein